MNKRYKWLEYLPFKPKQFDRSNWDLVNDRAFQIKDGRIPVLVATQYGIFPNKGMFNTLDGKKNPDYWNLEGLEGQRVGFVGISYLRLLSERPSICEIDLDASFMQRFRAEELFIDLRLWYDKAELKPGGPSFDPSVMNQPSTYREKSLATYIAKQKE